MRESPACPETQGLRRVLAGPASADEVERLARHLEVCGECGQMMDRLLEEDTFVDALRQPTQIEPEAERPVVQGLIARLQGLRRDASAAGAEPDVDETRGGPATAEKPPMVAERARVPQPQTGMPAPEGYDFLAPAQGPGEIGRLGPYRVVKVLGTGGMGVVFLAEDVHLQRYVALKAIRPALVERERIRDRFLREARAMAAVRSDHVVTVHQVGEDREVPFLAMELMEGETLQERLKRERQLPLAEVLRIGREMALGLEAAHRRGLIHRDVKPSNIWLEAGSGRVKILDFGLARASDDDTQLTGIGTVLGTPSYMPPEQAQSLPVDHRSDLFSLGCVLYQACTGQLPFKGKDLMSQLSALATVSPTPPHEVNAAVPVPVSELIMRLLAKDREARPESAGAVAESLAALESGLAAAVTLRGLEKIHVGESLRDSRPVSERPGYVSTLPAARRFTSRRWLIATAASAALLLVAILAGQIIIRITNRDGQVTEIRPAPGAKVEVIDTEKAPVRQAFQPDKPGSQAGKPDVHAGKPDLPLADKAKPFVLLRNGTQAGEFKGLGGALAALQAGDEIVVHGNGPFTGTSARMDVGLTLRAAPGYRPRFAIAKPDANRPWLELRGPLRVEGCDFVASEPVNFFSGGGGPCEFHACCACSHAPTAPGEGACSLFVVWSETPAVRVRDCLLINQEVRVYGAPEVELTNNIACLPNDQLVSAELVQKIRLTRNTIIGGRNVLAQKVVGPQRVVTQVEAVGNLFHASMLVWLNGPEGTQLKDWLAWQGRENLYVGDLSFYGRPHQDKPGKPYSSFNPEDFAAWKKLWGGEEGSQAVERVAFQPATFCLGSPDEALNWVRKRMEAIRQQLGAKAADCGPQWDLIGPGEPYVRALAAAGKPVPQDQLRPEELESGPIVLIRGGKALRGYVKLQDAVDVVQDGDTIEIRTDGPIVGCQFGAPATACAVTLRAAPGYRPAISDVGVRPTALRLTIEGLHFRNAGLLVADPVKQGCGLARLANCSFEGESRVTAAYWAPDGDAMEIQNCLIPRALITARRDPNDTTRLAIANSVLPWIWSDLVERALPIAIRQSIIESPGLVEGRESGQCFVCSADVVAERTLFDTAGGLGADPKRSWKGTGNIYSVLVGRPLEDLRTQWKSPEEGSLEADPLVFDPRSWQLLPSSPGYRAGPDGKDMGADVSRVANSSPAAQAAGQASQPGVLASQAGKPDVPAGSASDRRAAEWVLSLGGTVTIRVAGQEKDMTAAKDLPADPWQVIKVKLGGLKVSDAGLEHLQGLANITYLDLHATPVSDAGLEHLKGMTKLANLSLGDSRVTGAGLRHLKALPNLAELNLSSSPVTDAGLEGIKDLTQLTALSLHGTAVTDAGLVNLKGLTKLTALWLPSQVSDAGLEHVTALPELNLLSLDNTRVTDAGLPKLVGIAKLGGLNLENARVSARGFADLKRVLPGLNPIWSERNRTAAEAVLAAGGKLSIRPKGQQDDRPVTVVDELPAGYFQVTRVSLADVWKTPEDLAGKLTALNDADFDSLEVLDLSGQPLQAWPRLEGFSHLTALSLARSQVNDPGLEALKNLEQLRRLVLDGSPINGPGLQHVKDLPNLTDLRLGCPALTDLGLAFLGQMKQLERLSLAGSSVSDEGLKQLHGLRNLKELDLSQTKVTAAGRAELQKALPQCRMQF